jgi:aurora kinase
MIKALKYIHDLKIIHRDIKPENILLSINDEIKLTDFGWSVHVSDKRKKRKTFCGTPDYICPEIANQREYDYRLDLWCLGVLAYEFCAGKAPFSEHIDRRDLIRRIRELRF